MLLITGFVMYNKTEVGNQVRPLNGGTFSFKHFNANRLDSIAVGKNLFP